LNRFSTLPQQSTMNIFSFFGRGHELLIDQTGGEQIRYRDENKKWRHLTLAGN